MIRKRSRAPNPWYPCRGAGPVSLSKLRAIIQHFPGNGDIGRWCGCVRGVNGRRRESDRRQRELHVEGSIETRLKIRSWKRSAGLQYRPRPPLPLPPPPLPPSIPSPIVTDHGHHQRSAFPSYQPVRLVEGELGWEFARYPRAISAASSFALLRFLPSYQKRAEIDWPDTVTRLDQAVRPPVRRQRDQTFREN